MLTPPTPADETARIASLRALNVLDTLPEERFDRLTRLARRLFDVPIALVSLVDTDRQWFKSCVGLEATETDRDISFCGHAILGDDILLVCDALADERFHDNPLVAGDPNIRFYAGCPLTVADGSKLGTLCVIDSVPRQFTAEDGELLRDLAQMVEQELAAVQLATIDELTTLSNRRGFVSLATHALDRCQQAGEPASLMYFDLDQFKEINDRFGHAEGDRALSSFAQLLLDTFRSSDVVGRLGGDEFAVMIGGSELPGSSAALARLALSVAQHNIYVEERYELAYSVGTVLFEGTGPTTIAEMLAAADGAMFRDKRNRAAVATL